MTRNNQWKPRTMALAYRIWADCQQHGWYRTISEVADSLGEPHQSVRSVIIKKKWQNRFRSVLPGLTERRKLAGRHMVNIDAELEALS